MKWISFVKVRFQKDQGLILAAMTVPKTTPLARKTLYVTDMRIGGMRMRLLHLKNGKRAIVRRYPLLRQILQSLGTVPSSATHQPPAPSTQSLKPPIRALKP